jgi:hypothetical protein
MNNLAAYLSRPTTGEFERPLDGSGWMVAADAAIDGDYVCWVAEVKRTSPRFPGLVLPHAVIPAHTTQGGRKMLVDFLALAGAPNEAIARFIKKWGPLGIQKVENEWKTSLDALPLQNGTPLDYWPRENETAIVFDEIVGWEQISVWKHWAAKFGAVIRIFDVLRDRKAALLSSETFKQDWIVLTGDYDSSSDGKVLTGYDPSSDCEVVNGVTWYWLDGGLYYNLETWRRIAHLNLRIDVPGSFAETTFDGSTVMFGLMKGDAPPPLTISVAIQTTTAFAGVLFQLLAALSGATGFAVCSLCGKIYEPRIRLPRAGAKRLCGSKECRRRAHAIAVKNYKSRNKEKARRDVNERSTRKARQRRR